MGGGVGLGGVGGGMTGAEAGGGEGGDNHSTSSAGVVMPSVVVANALTHLTPALPVPLRAKKIATELFSSQLGRETISCKARRGRGLQGYEE